MKSRDGKVRRMGIVLKTALLSWLVTIVTLLIFIGVIVPYQKTTFVENLKSKARGIAASLKDVVTGAVVTEDYSSVVEHCVEVLEGDDSIDYLILTRNDGFSLVHHHGGWRVEQLGPYWRPERRIQRSGIETTSVYDRPAFQFSQPFDYSGIQWGWIHVGLSLKAYDQSVVRLYQRTGALTVLCVLFGLSASFFYAKRLVNPILSLQSVVRRVGRGDLSARARIRSRDEVEALADSFNRMTESIVHRDQIVQSVRFVAERFFRASDWREVLPEVLKRIGTAAQVSRIGVFENQNVRQGRRVSCLIEEQRFDKGPVQSDHASLAVFDWAALGLHDWVELLEAGKIASGWTQRMPEPAADRLETRGVGSLIMIPIVVKNAWWGCLGLEDERSERQWTEAERDSLGAAANTLGAAIEQKRTQDALLKAKEEAEAASQTKSQFLAHMSHEIRTPITGLIGMLELLSQQERDRSKGRFVRHALSSAKTLLAVIGDVLDFSKIEAGKMDLEERLFYVKDVVDDAVRLFAERAEEKGIDLAYRVDDSVPAMLRGDGFRFRQVLVNLVGNAVKFTEQGEVLVRCECWEQTTGTTTLRVTVCDTGCGIPRDRQDVIFEAFSQGDDSMSRTHGGSGLGLAICRQICELMGGAVGVQSEAGKGSVFWFTCQFRDSSDAQHRAAAPRDLDGMKILIADDHLGSRQVLQESVQSWRGAASVAADWDSALETFRAARSTGEPFDVIVLDWKLAGLDACSLAEAFKRDGASDRVGLVLLGGCSILDQSDQWAAAGFLGIVAKPMNPTDLYEAILRAGEKSDSLPPDEAREAPKQITHPVKKPGPILVVEDNAINREVVTEMLRKLGYECKCAHRGRQAVEMVKDDAMRLIFMDCQMPEMDGYETARRIRRWEKHRVSTGGKKRIPIVALTAHATKADREHCYEAGMDDYITKPLDLEQLVKTLDRWVSPVLPEIDGDRQDGSEVGIDFPALLARCLGNRALAERLISKLVSMVGEGIHQFNQALRDRDFDAVVATAHYLKGAAANVSVQALRDTAARIESAGRDRDSAAVRRLILKMSLQHQSLKGRSGRA